MRDTQTMAADVKRAANNPFRSLQVTPNPTGTGPSTSNVTSPSPQLPPLLQEQPYSLQQPQPEPESRRATTPPTISDNTRERDSDPLPRIRRSADDLADELQSTTLEENDTLSEPPPAYTPSANPYEGEATVEYGPHRPFQPAPPPPPLPQHFTGMSGMSGPSLRPQFSGTPAHTSPSPYMTPQATGMPIMPNRTGGWTSYPGQDAPSTSSLGPYGPPPRHPQLTGNGNGYANASASVSSPQVRMIPPAPTGNSNLSEFARDFYASSPVDPRVPSPSPSNASSGDVDGPEHFERAGPAASSSSAPASSYAPPPGPPPSARPPISSPSSYAPPAGPPPPPPRASSNTAEDLKPTTTPTSGRPLLNKGRTLVYPLGYECKKCLNTGYKQFDPSHPCRKCWEKFSKPYSGAIVYAPRTAQAQRPLPNLKPPHLGHRSSQSQSFPQSQFQSPILASSSSSSSGPGLFRSQTACRPPGSPWQGRTGSGFGPGLGLGPGRFMSPQQPIGMPSPPVNVTYGRPPPGSVVLRPGDPRIGGRLCWRCDGTGTVSFLIFDVEECPACRGVGRIFQ